MEQVVIDESKFRKLKIKKIDTTKQDYTYDIQVQDEHHYILENGIISHNTSVFAGQISNGIQPVFMQEYTRWVGLVGHEVTSLEQKHKNSYQGDDYKKIPNINLGQWHETHLFKKTQRYGDQILTATIDGMDYEIDKSRGLIKAMDVMDYGYRYIKERDLPQTGVVDINSLTVNNHLDMLQASANFVNQNQSKTINIPEEYSYQDFKDVYFDAWKRKIKGVTTYRAGTMSAVLEDKDKKKEYQSKLQELFIQNKDNVIKHNVDIPETSYSLHHKVRDKNKKKWYITVVFADKNYQIPFAMFIRTNNRQSTQVADKVVTAMQGLLRQSGIDQNLIIDQRQKYKGQTNVDKIARAIGMGLRHNLKIKDIVETLDDNNDGLSTLLFHIRKILSVYIKDGTKIDGKSCVECGSDDLVYQQGCSTCLNCGNSKCS